MSITPTTVDITLFFIVFLFAFLAFLKGFVKDFFSTLNLIIAIFASYTLGPILSKAMPQSSYPQTFVDLGSNFIVFVTTLIILAIISSRISTPLSERVPMFINQTLGFGFGFAKGYFMLAFVFAIFLAFYSSPIIDDLKKDEPHDTKIGPVWFRESKSYDILLPGADILKPVVDKYFEQLRGNIGHDILKNKDDNKDNSSPANGEGTIDEILKAKQLYDSIGDEGKQEPASPNSEVQKSSDQKSSDEQTTQGNDESGYTKQEMDKMKRLIEIMGN